MLIHKYQNLSIFCRDTILECSTTVSPLAQVSAMLYKSLKNFLFFQIDIPINCISLPMTLSGYTRRIYLFAALRSFGHSSHSSPMRREIVQSRRHGLTHQTPSTRARKNKVQIPWHEAKQNVLPLSHQTNEQLHVFFDRLEWSWTRNVEGIRCNSHIQPVEKATLRRSRNANRLKEDDWEAILVWLIFLQCNWSHLRKRNCCCYGWKMSCLSCSSFSSCWTQMKLSWSWSWSADVWGLDQARHF